MIFLSRPTKQRPAVVEEKMVFFAAVVHPKTTLSGGFRLCLESGASGVSGVKSGLSRGWKSVPELIFILTATGRQLSVAKANLRRFHPGIRRAGIARPAKRGGRYAGIASSGIIAPRCWITVLAVRWPRSAAACGEPPVRRCDR